MDLQASVKLDGPRCRCIAYGFPGLEAVDKITASREIDGKTTTASRYYILSKPISAARFLDVVRAHWHVENRLH